MQTYIIRRLLLMVPTVLLVATLTFGLLRLIPGDALLAQITSTSGTTVISTDQLEAIRRDMGLSGSIPEQYGRYLVNLVQGNLGTSYVSKQGTFSAFVERLPTTAELGLLAITFAVAIGVPIGVVSALRQDGPLDYIGRVVAIAGLAIPNFWLGIIVIVVASRQFHYAFPKGSYPLFSDPLTNLEQFVIPAFILSLSTGAVIMRLTRTTMLEVWRQDFIRTAHAKGLTSRSVIVRHALRNALLPVVTIIGAQLTVLIGGAVIVESLFTLRGVGLLTLQAISQRDYPQVQTNVLIFSTALMVGNLLTDLVYSVLDPRIRYG
ncbi:MAG: ABC transporter permease [Dehalococcoidia bacterium]